MRLYKGISILTEIYRQWLLVLSLPSLSTFLLIIYYIIFLFGLPFNPKCADNPDLIPNNLCRIIPKPSNVISMIANDAVYWMNVRFDCSSLLNSRGYSHRYECMISPISIVGIKSIRVKFNTRCRRSSSIVAIVLLSYLNYLLYINNKEILYNK